MRHTAEYATVKLRSSEEDRRRSLVQRRFKHVDDYLVAIDNLLRERGKRGNLDHETVSAIHRTRTEINTHRPSKPGSSRGKRIVLMCEECGWKLFFANPKAVFHSQHTAFGCLCGQGLTLFNQPSHRYTLS